MGRQWRCVHCASPEAEALAHGQWVGDRRTPEDQNEWLVLLRELQAPVQSLCFSTGESPMPTIRVELFEGRTPEQKRNLVAALTEAAVKTLGGSPESVDVLLFDIKPSDWSTGGVLWSEKKPSS